MLAGIVKRYMLASAAQDVLELGCRSGETAAAPAEVGHSLVSATPGQVRIADYDARLARYRGGIDAGGDPAVIGPRIAETQAKKVAAQVEIRTATGQRRMSRDEIEAVAMAFGDLARIVQNADPHDKADIYAKLRLTHACTSLSLR